MVSSYKGSFLLQNVINIKILTFLNKEFYISVSNDKNTVYSNGT